jgi:hypothetical protein
VRALVTLAPTRGEKQRLESAKSIPARAAPVVDAVYAAAILVLLALLAHHHLQIITAPAPIEIFEGTMVYFTELFAHGQNPFTFERQPEAMYVYTPLYNIVAAPLTLAFGNSVELHRIVSGVSILLSCGLLVAAARRLDAKWIDCAAVGALGYGALLYYATPIAATGALGELFFLAAVLIPWLDRWTARSLIASAVLGILAFYTKQYFLLSLGIVSVYLFLAVSKTRAVLYAAGAGAAFATSLAAIHVTSPYFLADVIFSSANTARRINTIDQLTMQLAVFAQVYGGVLLLAAGLAVLAILTALRSGTLLRALAPRLAPIEAPLLRAPPPYAWICFTLATAAIVVSLGQNPGQYMSYLFQLMTPFLLLGACATPLLRSPWRPLLLPLFAFSFFTSFAILPKDFSVTPDAWRRIEAIVCGSENPYLSPILVLAAVECGRPVHNAGHTSYFSFADLPGALQPHDLARQPREMWRAYLEEIDSTVAQQGFDVMVLAEPKVRFFGRSPGDPARRLIRQRYRDTEQIPLSFSNRLGGGEYVVHVWRPRNADASDVERGHRARPE